MVKATEDGVIALVQERWPRLQRHLLNVCGRCDINHGVELAAWRAVADPTGSRRAAHVAAQPP